MNTNISAKDGKAVIRLAGRFDFTGHREFREAVAQALEPKDVREVQVDFGDVAYLDSSALGMLLVLRDKARAVNRAVTLANCKGSVRQVLDIANFSALFSITQLRALAGARLHLWWVELANGRAVSVQASFSLKLAY